MGRVHVGRQPIFDQSLDVLGYELLFRAGEDAFNASENGDMATTRVILNAFTEFGLENLVGQRLAFVNLTRPFVVGTMPVPFTPDVAVLELLEHIESDPDSLAGVKSLRSEGYTIALDDFFFEPGRVDFLPYADYIKLDVLDVDPEVLARRVERSREHPAKLVAERVETAEHMQLAMDLGFDFYQGYFLLRPDVVSAHAITPAHLTAIELLARLAEPNIGVAELESIVRTDLALNYRVLRAANAAATGANRRIDSIRDALVLLGMQKLRSWLLLMVLADAGSGNEEQLTTAMTRARTCELLAQDLVGVKPEAAFIAGMLSSLEMVLGLPMETLLERMPLTDELEAALARGEGALGELLSAVIAYEKEDLAAVEDTGLALFDVSRAYLSAVGWSLQIFESTIGATT
jgi:c-di-GMP-related signal transduction protein